MDSRHDQTTDTTALFTKNSRRDFYFLPTPCGFFFQVKKVRTCHMSLILKYRHTLWGKFYYVKSSTEILHLRFYMEHTPGIAWCMVHACGANDEWRLKFSWFKWTSSQILPILPSIGVNFDIFCICALICTLWTILEHNYILEPAVNHPSLGLHQNYRNFYHRLRN